METQYIYLYDLPKDKVSGVQIAHAFKENAQVNLADSVQPQIKRDLTKPFYTAIVNIKDKDQYKQACEKMRYFDIAGLPCRALPFDRTLLGSNKDKLHQQNVFVRQIPKHFKHEDLHREFSKFGNIKALKISMKPNYESNGYGFVCFEEPAAATACLEQALPHGIQTIKFEPRDLKTSTRKLPNNIYVKNIPLNYSNDDVIKLFSPYGNIKSCVTKTHKIGQFAFVCYDDPNTENKNIEYGPQCAIKAIEALHGKEIGDGDKKTHLVVRHALKQAERQAEVIRDTIRYKTSKKRCNLYVKNFPADHTKEQLEKLFQQFGEIESIRLDKGKPNTNNAFAFVCFKEPTDAAKAKQALHNHQIGGKHLVICYYEIKEYRQLQNEAARDKADWEKYQQSTNGGFQWNELQQIPNLTNILTTLLHLINMHEPNKPMGGQGQDRMQGRYQGQRKPGMGGNMRGGQQQYPNAGNQMPGQPNMMMQGGMPQPGVGQRMPNQMQQNMPVPMPGMAPQPMQQMPQPGSGMPAGNAIESQYFQAAQRILPAVSDKNPHLQEQVGQCIYEFILKMVGSEQAPKITGMLIDLPHNQIKQYLSSYSALQAKVMEAKDHLRSMPA